METAEVGPTPTVVVPVVMGPVVQCYQGSGLKIHGSNFTAVSQHYDAPSDPATESAAGLCLKLCYAGKPLLTLDI